MKSSYLIREIKNATGEVIGFAIDRSMTMATTTNRQSAEAIVAALKAKEA